MKAVPLARMEELFHAALAQTPTDRESFLTTACGTDARLLADLRALLDHDRPDRLTGAVLVRRRPRPTMIGPYRILRPVGEGGFSLVYAAVRADRPRRRLAVKVVKPGLASAAQRARFATERRVLQAMDHAGVVTLLDAGYTHDRRGYLVLEFVAGEPITVYCRRRTLDLDVRLRLFGEVCAVVAHVHERGVIHCDLKPNNILVTGRIGRPRVKLIDFGIARCLAADGTASAANLPAGHVIGTPRYMSPEQATGGGSLDVRTDVHALGELLRDLLRGVPAGLPATTTALARVAEQARARDRRERFGDVRELATAVIRGRRHG